MVESPLLRNETHPAGRPLYPRGGAAPNRPAMNWSRVPLPIGLARTEETTMTELYVFRGTCGKAQMVTDDKSGKKLPPHPFGEWVFSKPINVTAETRLMGADTGRLLANIAK